MPGFGTGAPLGGSDYGISPYDFRRLSQARGDETQASVARSNASGAAYAAAQARGGQQADDARIAANRQKALDLTEGRGNAAMSDPYTQAALQRLQGVASGQNVPYTQQVQNQLVARQADAGSSAIDAQRQMLEQQQTALGGSMADPSAQAALRQLMARNQQQNNANIGDMGTKATLTNFGAQNDAAMNMAGVRSQQLGMANGQYNRAADLYAGEQFNGPHQSGVTDQAGTGGSGWSGQLGGGGSFQAFGSSAPYGNAHGNMSYGGGAVGPKPAPRPQGYSNSTTATNRLQGPYNNGGWSAGHSWAPPGTGTVNGQPNLVPKPVYGAYNPKLPVY